MAPKFAVAAAAVLASVASAAPSGPTAQVVGGETASAGQFPYLVSLSQGGSHFCGGSLLNANTVVTAAHCTSGMNAGSVSVRAGSTSRTSGGVTSGVSEFLIHPSYAALRTNNDIALWHLEDPISESSTIGYVSLPSSGSDPSAGTLTTTAGWGLTSENGATLPVTARYVEVPIVSRTECRSQYGSSAITTAMICAGEDNGGEDACSGDSGGPLVNSNTEALVGIVSWGNGCARANYAGVYTNVGQFVSWINQNAW